MWVYDSETLRFLAVNEAAVGQYGWSRREFLSMTVLDLLAPEDRPAFLEELLAASRFIRSTFRGGGPARRRHHVRDGAVIDVEVQAEAVIFAGHRGMLVLARNVTEREQLRAALGTTGDQLREAQAVAKVGIFEWDIVNNQVGWSDELYRIFGLTPQEFPGTFEGYLAAVHPEDRSQVESAVERSLLTLEPFELSHRAVLLDGTTRWLHCRGLVRGVDGRPVQMIGACQDFTAQREAAEALSQLALHDPLTGLPNRSLFIDRLGQALRRLVRQDRVLAVLFVDLDRFKVDQRPPRPRRRRRAAHGRRLAGCGRCSGRTTPWPASAATSSSCCARTSMTTGPPSEVAERVLAALDRPVVCGEQEVVCLGQHRHRPDPRAPTPRPTRCCATPTWPCTGPRRRAATASRCSTTPPGCGRQARLQTAEELRMAVDSDQLRVVYQPIVHLGRGHRGRAWRRWSGGSTPAGACSHRRSSSRWPRTPASSCRSAPGCCARPVGT